MGGESWTILGFLGLVIALNLVRHLVGGPIESVTIAEPMHRVRPEYPNVFQVNFTGTGLRKKGRYERLPSRSGSTIEVEEKEKRSGSEFEIELEIE